MVPIIGTIQFFDTGHFLLYVAKSPVISYNKTMRSQLVKAEKSAKQRYRVILGVFMARRVRGSNPGIGISQGRQGIKIETEKIVSQGGQKI